VAFVVSAVATTFVTVMTVACALMYRSFKITIAKPANIRVVVQCALKICFPHASPVMKCPVDMPFIGTASAN
jgi:hypothetical protein